MAGETQIVLRDGAASSGSTARGEVSSAGVAPLGIDGAQPACGLDRVPPLVLQQVLAFLGGQALGTAAQVNRVRAAACQSATRL